MNNFEKFLWVKLFYWLLQSIKILKMKNSVCENILLNRQFALPAGKQVMWSNCGILYTFYYILKFYFVYEIKRYRIQFAICTWNKNVFKKTIEKSNSHSSKMYICQVYSMLFSNVPTDLRKYSLERCECFFFNVLCKQ